jgi:hypothetical protein
MDGGGEANPTRVGHRFQSRRDVHAVAVEITLFDDHVAEIQSDPQNDCAVVRQRGIGILHRLLEIDSTLYRINGTREFRQGAVAHEVYDATAVLGE